MIDYPEPPKLGVYMHKLTAELIVVVERVWLLDISVLFKKRQRRLRRFGPWALENFEYVGEFE